MRVIPDSSFFICFIHDLEGLVPAEIRHQFLNCVVDHFTVHVVPGVTEESPLTELSHILLEKLEYVDPEEFDTQINPVIESLRPLLGKGEFQVITFAYRQRPRHGTGMFFILDDDTARDLVIMSVPELSEFMKGTAGFIGYCTISGFYDKKEAINLLSTLPKSKFRINSSIVKAVITEIQSRYP